MTESVTLVLDNPGQTERLGRRIGAVCEAGDVLLLAGELGAGKTTMAGGIARGLGVPDQYPVTSPSFALLHEYPGRVPFYHMDCYRLTGEEDIEAAGLAEYLEGAGVCAIEWPDRLGGLRPESCLEIRIGSSGGEGRTVTLTAHGRSWRQRLPQLAATAGSASGPGR